jgi:hypothetical protein
MEDTAMSSIFRSARVGQSAKWSILLLVAIAFALAPGASAYPLTGTTALADIPGNALPGDATGVAPGTLVATQTDPWSFTTTAGTTKGTLTAAVYMESGGTLDFYYQVVNDASSKTAIGRESATFFDDFLTSVGFRTDGSTLAGAGFVDGTIAPQVADRGTGVIGFAFKTPASNPILPGEASNVLIISTNGTKYVPGNAEILDGGSFTVTAFQPANVPEPATMALLGGGLLALAGIRRYRR